MVTAVYWKCSKCGLKWNVDTEQPGSEKNYICPHCQFKMRNEVKIFGKKTRRKAKRKALRAGKQLSA